MCGTRKRADGMRMRYGDCFVISGLSDKSLSFSFVRDLVEDEELERQEVEEEQEEVRFLVSL